MSHKLFLVYLLRFLVVYSLYVYLDSFLLFLFYLALWFFQHIFNLFTSYVVRLLKCGIYGFCGINQNKHGSMRCLFASSNWGWACRPPCTVGNTSTMDKLLTQPHLQKIPLMIQNPMSVSGRNPMFIQIYNLMKLPYQLRHEYFTVAQLPPCPKSLEKVERHNSKRCLSKPQLGHCFAFRTELS